MFDDDMSIDFDIVMARATAGTATESEWEIIAAAGMLEDLPPIFHRRCPAHLRPSYIRAALLGEDIGADPVSKSATSSLSTLSAVGADFSQPADSEDNDTEDKGEENIEENSSTDTQPPPRPAFRQLTRLRSEEEEEDRMSPEQEQEETNRVNARRFWLAHARGQVALNSVSDPGYPFIPDDVHGFCSCRHCFKPDARRVGACVNVEARFQWSYYHSRNNANHVWQFQYYKEDMRTEFGNGPSPLCVVENAEYPMDVVEVVENEVKGTRTTEVEEDENSYSFDDESISTSSGEDEDEDVEEIVRDILPRPSAAQGFCHDDVEHPVDEDTEWEDGSNADFDELDSQYDASEWEVTSDVNPEEQEFDSAPSGAAQYNDCDYEALIVVGTIRQAHSPCSFSYFNSSDKPDYGTVPTHRRCTICGIRLRRFGKRTEQLLDHFTKCWNDRKRTPPNTAGRVTAEFQGVINTGMMTWLKPIPHGAPGPENCPTCCKPFLKEEDIVEVWAHKVVCFNGYKWNEKNKTTACPTCGFHTGNTEYEQLLHIDKCNDLPLHREDRKELHRGIYDRARELLNWRKDLVAWKTEGAKVGKTFKPNRNAHQIKAWREQFLLHENWLPNGHSSLRDELITTEVLTGDFITWKDGCISQEALPTLNMALFQRQMSPLVHDELSVMLVAAIEADPEQHELKSKDLAKSKLERDAVAEMQTAAEKKLDAINRERLTCFTAHRQLGEACKELEQLAEILDEDEFNDAEGAENWSLEDSALEWSAEDFEIVGQQQDGSDSDELPETGRTTPEQGPVIAIPKTKKERFAQKIAERQLRISEKEATRKLRVSAKNVMRQQWAQDYVAFWADYPEPMEYSPPETVLAVDQTSDGDSTVEVIEQEVPIIEEVTPVEDAVDVQFLEFAIDRISAAGIIIHETDEQIEDEVDGSPGSGAPSCSDSDLEIFSAFANYKPKAYDGPNDWAAQPFIVSADLVSSDDLDNRSDSSTEVSSSGSSSTQVSSHDGNEPSANVGSEILQVPPRKTWASPLELIAKNVLPAMMHGRMRERARGLFASVGDVD